MFCFIGANMVGITFSTLVIQVFVQDVHNSFYNAVSYPLNKKTEPTM